MVGIIYRAVNLINKKCYIGKTAYSLDGRKGEHLSCAFKKNKKSKFYNALRKYPNESDWKWEVLKDNIEFDPEEYRDNLDWHEIWAISTFDSVKNGYNMTYGGGGSIPSEETRKNMSIAQSGENNGMFGKRHKEKTIQILRKPKSEIAKQNMSKNHADVSGSNNPMLGKPNLLKGVPLSNETKRKISKAKKGKPLSSIHKRKISEGLSMRHTKQKIEQ